jgi:alkylated DNA nucleotide flippase Atl1
VVNARGLISRPSAAAVEQRLRLAAEGVPVNAAGGVALRTAQWVPRGTTRP